MSRSPDDASLQVQGAALQAQIRTASEEAQSIYRTIKELEAQYVAKQKLIIKLQQTYSSTYIVKDEELDVLLKNKMGSGITIHST